ncbi:NAD(P)-binding protein [Marasmius fiardii PR-910]|nr:NAD(P)-binding protein [Marasmius fiardii PR-910]
MPQTVFLAGATGTTGSSIAKALASQPEKFSVKAIIRSASLEKPVVQELKASGIEIITGDINIDSVETLEGYLKGVDTVIIATNPFYEKPDHQHKLILAAKNAQVKRVVPSDFGTYAPPGSMKYQDEKVVTQEFIERHGVPYTFIQVGLWMDFMFPLPHSQVNTPEFPSPSQKEFYGSGKTKSTYTSIKGVGEFVARIISDPRTINRTVQTWDVELTVDEIWAIGEAVSGEKFDDYPRVSAEEVESRIREGPEGRVYNEYMRNVFIRGENTVKNAVEAGALDARVLYPDYVPPVAEEFAKQFYGRFGVVKS